MEDVHSKLFVSQEGDFRVSNSDYAQLLDGGELPLGGDLAFVPTGEIVKDGRMLSASGIMRETVANGDDVLEVSPRAIIIAVEPGFVARGIARALRREPKIHVSTATIVGARQPR